MPRRRLLADRRWWLAGVLAAATLVYACAMGWRAPAPPPVVPAPATWSADDLSIAWIGHASVLIDFEGVTMLTDPTFFARIGLALPGVTLGPKRLVQSALAPEELPALDAVLVSHAHLDSLDRPSLGRLAAAPLLVVPARSRDLVDDLGFGRVVELGWGETVQVGEVTIEAVPVNHWGKRWPWSGWRGYNGYLFTRGARRVLFASDTAYTPAIAQLGRERGIAAAILGIGAYDPWIMNHADPEEAWRMFEESGACFLLPVHWDTFRLGKEPLGEAMARLLAVAGRDADRVVIRRIGETWTMPSAGCAR